MRPRRAQQAITFRSDRAAARLRLLTRDGRSQAEVIERALEEVVVPPADDEADRVARVEALLALVRRIPPNSIPSMAEFDAREYDERGNPR